jgi:hypothetical protein
VIKESDPVIVAPVFHEKKVPVRSRNVMETRGVFIPEEEAIEIIRDELGKYGIRFEKKNVHIKKLHEQKYEGGIDYNKLERLEKEAMSKGDKSNYDKSQADALLSKHYPFFADLMNEEKKIVIEYVSKDDYYRLGGRRYLSSFVSYNFLDVAKKLREQVKDNGKGFYFGVFYDPDEFYDSRFIEFPEDDQSSDIKKGESENEYMERVNILIKKRQAIFKKREKEANQRARFHLRKQIKDFISWLKKQDVIK